MTTYTKSYYHSGNYRFYMQAGPRYNRMARELISLLSSINIVDRNTKTLDYGCGLGFLMEGLNSFHTGETFGYDISEWAREECRKKELAVFDSLQQTLQQSYDLCWFLDVLEHMQEDEIDEVLSQLDTNYLTVRIPVAKVEGERFYLEVSNNDETHITCHSKTWWNNLFSKHNYQLFITLNLASIYDSDGVYCAMFKKNTNSTSPSY